MRFSFIRKPCIKIREFSAWSDDGINLPNLPTLITKPNTDFDSIKLINSFVNCEMIKMSSFHHKLQPIKLTQLKKLKFSGYFSSFKITSICDHAFYECDQLELIDLQRNNTRNIGEYAFFF